ncbi:MAG: hypothetical protein AAGH78_16610 [Cyanobacteria bacterium P01_H01_bin.58]
MIPTQRVSIHLPQLIVGTLLLGVSLGVARPAIADGIPGVVFGDETGTVGPRSPQSTTVDTPAQDGFYRQAMEAGYEAAGTGRYRTALFYFEQALEFRPGDQEALSQIARMNALIARQTRILELRTQLSAAVDLRDWACAARVVDQLVTFSEPASLDRARLVAYRGELSELLDARVNIENWSVVCPG